MIFVDLELFGVFDMGVSLQDIMLHGTWKLMPFRPTYTVSLLPLPLLAKCAYMLDTGQIGEDIRKGICITWYLEDPCIALAHFTMMWAPGGPKMISLRRK